MSRIIWDTNLYVYLREDYGSLPNWAAALRRSMLERGDQLLTSAFTLGEVLVKPAERGSEELYKSYEEAIRTTSALIPFD